MIYCLTGCNPLFILMKCSFFLQSKFISANFHQRFGSSMAAFFRIKTNCTRHEFIAMHGVITSALQPKFNHHSVLGATESESALDSVAGATASASTSVRVRDASRSRPVPRLLDDVIERCIQAQQSGNCQPASRFSLRSGGISRICRASFMRRSVRLEAESKI